MWFVQLRCTNLEMMCAVFTDDNSDTKDQIFNFMYSIISTANSNSKNVIKQFIPSSAKNHKIEHLQAELNDIKNITVRNIDAILQRGEKLDSLVAKTQTLADESEKFHHTTKQLNRCCDIL